jgi:hypothetical protein
MEFSPNADSKNACQKYSGVFRSGADKCAAPNRIATCEFNTGGIASTAHFYYPRWMYKDVLQRCEGLKGKLTMH